VVGHDALNVAGEVRILVSEPLTKSVPCGRVPLDVDVVTAGTRLRILGANGKVIRRNRRTLGLAAESITTFPLFHRKEDDMIYEGGTWK
jgi:hypothetical protein